MPGLKDSRFQGLGIIGRIPKKETLGCYGTFPGPPGQQEDPEKIRSRSRRPHIPFRLSAQR
jgi:hypothetical protein